MRRTAWYEKSPPTFSDAVAVVRKELWAEEAEEEEATFGGSAQENGTVNFSREFIDRLTDAVCYAA